jgi:hypothetical protein
MKRENPERRRSERERAYGPPERRAWIKTLPCVACLSLSPFFAAASGPSDNAHVETDGMGRKADYTRIVPLCRNHHRRYDEHRVPFDKQAARDAIAKVAARVERMWLRHHAAKGGPNERR